MELATGSICRILRIVHGFAVHDRAGCHRARKDFNLLSPIHSPFSLHLFLFRCMDAKILRRTSFLCSRPRLYARADVLIGHLMSTGLTQLQCEVVCECKSVWYRASIALNASAYRFYPTTPDSFLWAQIKRKNPAIWDSSNLGQALRGTGITRGSRIGDKQSKILPIYAENIMLKVQNRKFGEQNRGKWTENRSGQWHRNGCSEDRQKYKNDVFAARHAR